MRYTDQVEKSHYFERLVTQYRSFLFYQRHSREITIALHAQPAYLPPSVHHSVPEKVLSSYACSNICMVSGVCCFRRTLFSEQSSVSISSL